MVGYVNRIRFPEGVKHEYAFFSEDDRNRIRLVKNQNEITVVVSMVEFGAYTLTVSDAQEYTILVNGLLNNINDADRLLHTVKVMQFELLYSV